MENEINVCVSCGMEFEGKECTNEECVLHGLPHKLMEMDPPAIPDDTAAKVLEGSPGALEILSTMSFATNSMVKEIDQIKEFINMIFKQLGFETRIIVQALLKKELVTEEELTEIEHAFIEEAQQVEEARIQVQGEGGVPPDVS